MKILLKKALWNHKQGETIEVDEFLANFAIRKGYAELILEPKKAESTDYKNKIEPDVKKLRNKRNAN